jgi:UDP:flavonoid glycosyltransferase YjiC (YdhE family)
MAVAACGCERWTGSGSASTRDGRLMATFLFFPEGAFGPTNNCVGIGHVLQQRGHRVVFLVEESFAGTLEAKGFEERLMRLAPAPESPETPGQFWKDFVRDTSPVFRRPTIEALGGFIEPTFRALCDGARYVDARLAEVLDEVDPAVVVEDNVVAFPAILASGRRWVRIMSCNPLELPDPDLPPVFSGYPTDDRSHWAAYLAAASEILGPLHAEFDQVCRDLGAPGLPHGQFIHQSRWLNLALYPAELDYQRSQPLPTTWHKLQASVREPELAWLPPTDLGDPETPLVYLSLGSLGSADLPLMRQLVDALAQTRCRVVVSKGPLHDQLELPSTMSGEEFLPQISVLPKVDVVITHGGNNTVTESLFFGKPMVVLPLFWDQHDNAQRIHETGVGVRCSTYESGPVELAAAIDVVRNDPARLDRLAAISRRLQAAPGTWQAADLLESLARNERTVVS